MLFLFFCFSFVSAWSIWVRIARDAWDAALNWRMVVRRFVQKVMLHTIGIRNQGSIEKSRHNRRCQEVAKYSNTIDKAT